MSRPPEATANSTPQASRWRGWSKRNPREPLAISIKFRGGPECWYEVRARGGLGRYPGHTALHDIMRDVNQSG